MSKPWTSVSEQTQILVSRGLEDAPDFAHYLSQVGYYRLSGYSYPLRQFASTEPGGIRNERDGERRRLDSFVSGAKMRHVISLYEFDVYLRQTLWQALSKLEVALRFDIGYTFGETDPYLHLHVRDFWNEGRKRDRAQKFSKKLEEAQKRSSEEFVRHHRRVYGNKMPIWVATEILEFGSLVNLYTLAPFEQRERVASNYGARSDELESWLRVMNYLRNICAHHARLWNRQVVIRPVTKYRRNDPELSPCLGRDDKIFASMSIAAFLLERKGLTEPISALVLALSDFPANVPQCHIGDRGVPENWKDLSLWSRHQM